MLHLPKKNKICPVCGNLGKNFKLGNYVLKTCPICGTVYNEFAIILTQEKDDEELRTKITNN